jgi:predicted DNA binding CopG/RHH family protein
MKDLKKIPDFKTEQEEREFWLKEDSTGYLDMTQAKQGMFEDIKPSTKTISLRLPANLLRKIRRQANENDVPYQSLIKLVLSKSFS